MYGMIVEGNSKEHSGHAYIVRGTKMGRHLTQNTRHIQKIPIMARHYLREQIVKGTGCLGDIHRHKLYEYNRVFNPIYSRQTSECI